MKKILSVFILGGAISISAAIPVVHCTYNKNIDAYCPRVPAAELKGWLMPLSSRWMQKAEMTHYGVSGKAFLLDCKPGSKRPYSITYVLRKPLRVTAASGTISGWVAPLDWNGSEKKNHKMFFSFVGDKNKLIVYKYNKSTELNFLYQVNGKNTVVKYNISAWKKREFHHIAAAWNPESITLYVDGVPVASKKKLQASSAPYKNLVIGKLPQWKPISGESLIDEVKVFESCLSNQEVKELFTFYSSVVRR